MNKSCTPTIKNDVYLSRICFILDKNKKDCIVLEGSNIKDSVHTDENEKIT